MCIIWARWRRLSPAEHALLRALAAGATLKVHRELDGAKTHRLHPPDGPTCEIADRTVLRLKQRGLIESNMKFPVATYLLTDKGKQTASGVVQR